jgi:hypothetical protein
MFENEFINCFLFFKIQHMKFLFRNIVCSILIFSSVINTSGQEKKSLTLQDVMQFKVIRNQLLSDDGKWIVHVAAPDRGDPEVLVYSSDVKVNYILPMGDKPRISKDGSWVLASKVVSAEEAERAKSQEQEAKSQEPRAKSQEPRAGAYLLKTSSGEKSVFENIQSYSFSNDSKWILLHHSAEKKGAADKKDDKEKPGTKLCILSLERADTLSFSFVNSFTLDSLSNFLAFSVIDTNKLNNGLYIAELGGQGRSVKILGDTSTWIDNLTWNNSTGELAFLAGMKDVKERRLDAKLYFWKPGMESAEAVLTDGDLQIAWKIYHTNKLRWSKDGERLFLGLKPESEYIPFEDKEKDTIVDLMDMEKILEKRTVDVWHWNDPYINSNQKKRWKTEKDRTYTAVYYPAEKKLVQLADEQVPDVRIDESSNYLIALSNVPYARQATWEGRIYDYYLVDLKTGNKKLVVERQEQTVRLSPDGKYLVYFKEGDWYMLNAESLSRRNLTGGMDVSFSDEDWDYPADAPGYGVAGWIDASNAVMIYDKYDIWQFSTSGGEALCLTEGRQSEIQYRIRKLENENRF